MKNILDPYFLHKMGWIKPKNHFTLLFLLSCFQGREWKRDWKKGRDREEFLSFSPSTLGGLGGGCKKNERPLSVPLFFSKNHPL
jgi:hypothetical protein